jgi:ethylbenzene dehydrogenase
VISKDTIKKAYKGTAADGSTIYISRPSDKGSKLYTTKRYSTKDKEIMPKYIPVASASGSIADVKAKGVWSNGKWTLEMSRKLNTGNADDVAFAAGQAVVGGLVVFDHSGDDDHSHSSILKFQF